MNRAWFGAISTLLGSSFFLSVLAAQPTLKERALKAPAYDLARGYSFAKLMLKFIPLAQGGVTIQTGEGEVTKENFGQYQQEYSKRLSTYAEAITQRGYAAVSGSYQATTTKSCGRIQSSWVGLVDERPSSRIEIKQEGFEAQLIVREGGGPALENEAIVVETAILVNDAMNSDYNFRGEVKGKDIVIKPDISVLAGWPEWAKPPREKDFEECTITLQPLKGNSGKSYPQLEQLSLHP